jgi:hypothetical protein
MNVITNPSPFRLPADKPTWNEFLLSKGGQDWLRGLTNNGPLATNYWLHRVDLPEHGISVVSMEVRGGLGVTIEPGGGPLYTEMLDRPEEQVVSRILLLADRVPAGHPLRASRAPLFEAVRAIKAAAATMPPAALRGTT